jgi:diguanylate cyclase (GGDEF)-like protein
MTDLLGTLSLGNLQIPTTLALAAVATLGYLIGRQNRGNEADIASRSRHELRRAQAVARELEKIAWMVRHNLAKHHASLTKFKQRVADLSSQEQEAQWKDLCREASEILTPTLRLASQIACAYDEIRQQSNHLMTFTEARTDPLTGISNRRSLDESLAAQIALMNRYELGFSVAIFDIDHFKHINDEQGHLHGDRMLQQVASLLDESARETDIVARYGGEEFVAIMPRTNLEGACQFAERIRTTIEEEMPLTVSGGVTVALDGDTPESIMSRADAAMYRAKAAGRNCVFRHDGEHVESIFDGAPLSAANA